MGRISEADIKRVKRSTDLVALVQSRGIELKRHGNRDWIGRCPFHSDQDSSSFVVTPDEGLWHCMACGLTGNPIEFIERHDGVSFRHSFELLNQGGTAAFAWAGSISRCGPLKNATVPKLPCPLDLQAEDAVLLGQVSAYYHERLKQSSAARTYLTSRGLDSDELIEHFQLGFADRTLGLRLPHKNRNEGKALRSRLQQLGLWRQSGHEHFNGCIVVPLLDDAGQVASFYGRRVAKGALRHLYAPGPRRGLLNRQCLLPPEGIRNAEEVILCETVFDALTFWANGFRNVTCLLGTEGIPEVLWDALKHVRRVKLAYDGDSAGEQALQRDAQRLRARGVEVWRIKFPHGLGANEYAREVQPADKSLALLLNSAQWLGEPRANPAAAPPEPPKHMATMDRLTGQPPPILDNSSSGMGIGWAPSPFDLAPYADAQAQAAVPCLGAELAPDTVQVAKNETAAIAPPSPSGALAAGPTRLEQRGDAWFLDIEGREYRVAGLEKTLGTDTLKIALRLRRGELFHLDTVDLTRDAERRRFIERAAEETGLLPDLLKRDIGRVLLAVEEAQAELAKPTEVPTPQVILSPEEREAALTWLRAPHLIGRLREAFHQAGIIGEETNTLVAYLTGVSRKLERPLAMIIQSASAAGKTTLMDAVLSFFPEEERVKYSAMTGQSLYYLGETNLKHKILAVVEEAGAERASYALKLLQSEGELTIASTGKDPQSGRMVTQEYHVEGPVTIFLTTAAIDLDEELQNRCLTLAVDETSEQTRRIHHMQRERRTLAGLLAREQRKDVLQKLCNAQRLLQPVAVVNPYATALTFRSDRTRNRRDHEKYLTLIDSIALLHQYQREAEPLPNAPDGANPVSYVKVTLDDIALANELAPEVLGRSLDELPPQTRRLLGFIRELMKQKRTSNAKSAKVATGIWAGGAATFSRKELRDHCGWSLTQVSVHLERLVALEYLSLRHGRLGSAFVYEILFDLDASETVAHVGLIDVAQLKHGYAGKVSGLSGGVPGKSGQVTGGVETTPTPFAPLALNALTAR